MEAEKRRLRWRFFGSLVLLGLMIGMMIGRLTAPGPIALEAVEEQPWGLSLWYDREPVVRGEVLHGALVLHVAARAEAQQGQLRLGDTLVNWRVRSAGEISTVGFVATRALHGRWQGEAVDGRWRIDVRLAPHPLD